MLALRAKCAGLGYTLGEMALDPTAFAAAAARIGLNVILPLGPGYEERADPSIRLAALAPWALGGWLLLSGGPAFFAAFSQTEPNGADPLDSWTRDRVAELLAPLREAGVRAEARFPFWNEPDPLPFLRIGGAAGAGTSSRLGLTLHQKYGTWIAYRALILVDRPVHDGPRAPPVDACAGCAAPCIPACPAGALASGSWEPAPCLDHRLASPSCEEGCLSRLACPMGLEHRLPREALRFHQAASLAFARSFRSGP